MGKRVLSILAAFVVAGCGGSSGGGSVATPVANLVLTSDNAIEIAGSTTEAALLSAEFDELANLGLVGSPTMAAVALQASDASVTLAKQTAQLQAVTAEVSVGPETSDCPQGGVMTISANIQNPESLAAGDTFSLNYSDCDFGEGFSVDGGVGFTVTSFQGDLLGEQFALGFDLQIDNLRMAEMGETFTMDGDMSMSLDFDGTNSTVTLSGDSLTMTNGVDSFSLARFATTATADMSVFPEAVTIQTSGFLMSSEFDGEVEFETITPFIVSGEGNPASGELLITGADGATIHVMPMDGGTVRLEMDLDGDNAVDAEGSLELTWQELLDQPVE